MDFIKKLTTVFVVLAVISFLFCVLVYSGFLNMGHGRGIPVIVIFTSLPAIPIFFIVLLISFIKLRDQQNSSTTIIIRRYYTVLILNIVINAITSFALYIAVNITWIRI